jgi:hypothetical protein
MRNAIEMIQIAQSAAAYGQQVVTVDRNALERVLNVAKLALERDDLIEAPESSDPFARELLLEDIGQRLDEACAALRGAA